MIQKFWQTMLFPVLFFLLIPTGNAQEVLFPTFREKVKNIVPLSPEDFKLGEELMVEIRKLATNRRKTLPHTILVAESLSSAGMMWFTNHNYTDRQLFAARDVWEPSRSQFKKAGHSLTFELMKLSGFDAFTTFLYKERGRVYLENMEAIKPDFHYVMGLCPKNYEGKLEPELLKKAAQSQYTLRINGKILLLNYTSLNIPETREFIREVEGYCGAPVAYIHSNGTIPDLEDPFVFHFAGKGVPATTILYWFDYLSKMLDVCDGIAISNHLQRPDGTLDHRYYDEILFPVFAAVCAQEQYNGKKILSVRLLPGYNNYRGKQRTSHDGTKTLRSFLELCCKYKADVLKAF